MLDFISRTRAKLSYLQTISIQVTGATLMDLPPPPPQVLALPLDVQPGANGLRPGSAPAAASAVSWWAPLRASATGAAGTGSREGPGSASSAATPPSTIAGEMPTLPALVTPLVSSVPHAASARSASKTTTASSPESSAITGSPRLS